MQNPMFQFRQDAKILKIICSAFTAWYNVVAVVVLHGDTFPRETADTFDRAVFTDSEHGKSTVFNVLRGVYQISDVLQ